MNAALLFLTEAWRYEQVEETDLTAAETAATWYEIYVQYLTGECEGVGCCTELRTDPNTGRLQYTEDGGLTWFDVEDGPWVDAPNVAIASLPPPLAQGTDDADRCLAAWNAADVIAEFYRQTAGAAAAGLYNTLLSMNMFLNELNNALLEIAYPNAGQLLNASGFLDFDWGEYAEAPTLDSTALDALRCLLYDNASVTGGIVSFDHGAVYDNLIAELGVNPGTAVTLLVGYMGEAGLNHAGGILANDSADCAECNPVWCYTWDFSVDNGGWVTFDFPWSTGPTSFGTYGSGKWNGQYKNGSGWQRNSMGIRKVTPLPATVTRVEVEHEKVSGNYIPDDNGSWLKIGIQFNSSINHFDQEAGAYPATSPWVWEGEQTGVNSIHVLQTVCGILNNVDSCNGNGNVTRVTIYGTGENPFGEDNC